MYITLKTGPFDAEKTWFTTVLACQLLVEFRNVFTGHLNTCTVANNIQPKSLPPLMPVWMDEDSYSDNINHDLYVENFEV